jgi:Flp pilus assembly pilin Flp
MTACAAARTTASVSELVRGRLGIRRGDHGATSVEYALMVGLIALVIVAAVTIFGRNVITLYDVPSSIFAP